MLDTAVILGWINVRVCFVPGVWASATPSVTMLSEAHTRCFHIGELHWPSTGSSILFWPSCSPKAYMPLWTALWWPHNPIMALTMSRSSCGSVEVVTVGCETGTFSADQRIAMLFHYVWKERLRHFGDCQACTIHCRSSLQRMMRNRLQSLSHKYGCSFELSAIAFMLHLRCCYRLVVPL